MRLRAGTVIDVPTPPSVAFAQHIVGVTGKVRFTVGESSFVVGPGGGVAARIDRPTGFEVLEDRTVEYLVVIERGGR